MHLFFLIKKQAKTLSIVQTKQNYFISYRDDKTAKHNVLFYFLLFLNAMKKYSTISTDPLGLYTPVSNGFLQNHDICEYLGMQDVLHTILLHLNKNIKREEKFLLSGNNNL